jgi:hypothetical protein
MSMGWLAKATGFVVLSAAPLLIAIPAVGREDASESVAERDATRYVATVLDRKSGSLTIKKESGEVEIFSLDDSGLTLRVERGVEKGSRVKVTEETTTSSHTVIVQLAPAS